MTNLWVYPNPNLTHFHPQKIFRKANKILTHNEHNKNGLLAIKLISPTQTINGTTSD
jgi:hypothetical protein